MWEKRKERLTGEIQTHIEMETQENIEAGMEPEAARQAALRKFGNVPVASDQSRVVWGWLWLEQLGQDMRYTVRSLAKSPGFTSVALLSLMLGIGASVALFSVVYGVVIAPFPYAHVEQICWPATADKNDPMGAIGRHLYTLNELHAMEKSGIFAGVWAMMPESDLLTGNDVGTESVTGVRMSGEGFNDLGVPPLMGRTIQPFDTRANSEPAQVVVLTYKFWKRVFAGDPHVLGRKLNVNHVPYTVIGVMPPRFGWWTPDTFWLPMSMDSTDSRPKYVAIRLRAGVNKRVAEQQLSQFDQEMAAIAPEHFPKGSIHATLDQMTALNSAAQSGLSKSLNLLLAAVGLLLLIACVNVANLQLARMTTRTREIAMRVAIGAGRGRLIRQLLTESVLLSLAGGVLGVLLAIGATRGIVALIPPDFMPNEARIAINGYVLLFTVGISMLTGILFGLAPALRSSRPDLVGVLKEGGSGSGGSLRGQAMRGGLVVTEIALSVILLTGASLAIRNFMQLMTTDLGFQPEKALVVPMNLPPERYKTLEQRNAFSKTLVEKVASLPGVQASAIGLGGFPFGGWNSPFSIEGQPQTHNQIAMSAISSGYLRTMGMTLKRGRDFTPEEIQDGAHVALINETAAKLWKAGQDPTSGHLHLDVLAQNLKPPVLVAPNISPDMAVVGVVGDTRNWGLDAATHPAVYVPYTLIAPPFRVLAVRTYGDPMAILKAVGAQVKQIDDNLPLGRPYTVEEIVGFQTAQPRFAMALLSAFALLGMTLAAIGIYCVISYNVTQKVHEIGVRMALGASREAILRWVLRAALKIAALGLLIGLVGSFAVERVMGSYLFGKVAFDVGSIMGVVAVLSVVALLAAWLPARRAGKLDPVRALREEA
ncbi:MAG: ABC transporter permease [Terracidiphilus sp.]|nr:ABC transporter permease [Terracidiphilus sp.]